VSDTQRDKLKTWSWRWLTWAVGLLGIVGCGLLLRELGATEVKHQLVALGPWIPALLILEGLRAACELWGTWAVLGPARARLSWLRLLRGQLLAQTLDVVMPAGRATAEAAKAAVFARDIGMPEAVAIGAVMQLATLFGSALWALTGFCASLRMALPHALAVGLLSYGTGMAALVLLVVAFARTPTARNWCTRVPCAYAVLDRFAALVNERPRVLLLAAAAQSVARGCQAAQVAVLLTALSGAHGLRHIVLGESVYLVGAAAGDLVPAQLGTTDGAFVLAAATFGLHAHSALTLTLAMHGVQVLTACAAGILALALWTVTERDRNANAKRTQPGRVDAPTFRVWTRACESTTMRCDQRHLVQERDHLLPARWHVHGLQRGRRG
jgi:hypothetical protein